MNDRCCKVLCSTAHKKIKVRPKSMKGMPLSGNKLRIQTKVIVKIKETPLSEYPFNLIADISGKSVGLLL